MSINYVRIVKLIMKLLHGTSLASYEACQEQGILPCSETGISRENRANNTNQVFLLDRAQPHSLLMAGGYALRAALQDNSKPLVVVVDGEALDRDISLERSGHGRHFDQYTVPFVPTEAITGTISVPVTPTVEAAVQLQQVKPY